MKCLIQNVLDSLGLKIYFTSVGTLGRLGLQITFTENGASIYREDKLYVCGEALGRLYVLDPWK